MLIVQTNADAIRWAQAELAAGSDSPRLDAEILLRHTLGWSRTELFTRLRDPLEPPMAARFAALVEARRHGTPVAYLTGQREFFGLPLWVRPGVLVPRPETELLVEWALAWLAPQPTATVIDVGTGSGAIALALAASLPAPWHGRIIGVDPFPVPLATATANRHHLGLDGRVDFVRGSLVAWTSGPLDLVAANLPYLRPEQVMGNRELAAEPVSALVAGDDGLALINALIADLPRVLSPAGAVILEIDPEQADRVAARLTGTFPDATVTVMPDLAGHSRFVTADRRQPGAKHGKLAGKEGWDDRASE